MERIIEHLKIMTNFNRFTYSSNKIVVRHGDFTDLIYFVEDGWLKITKSGEDGRDSIIDIIGPSGFIGLPTLFKTIEYPISATAMTASNVLSIPKKKFENYLIKNPLLMTGLIAHLGEQVLTIKDIVFATNQQDSRQQIYHLLYHCAHKYGHTFSDGWIVPFKLTQQDIADFLGLSRPSVNIALKNLENSGHIRRHENQFVV